MPLKKSAIGIAFFPACFVIDTAHQTQPVAKPQGKNIQEKQGVEQNGLIGHPLERTKGINANRKQQIDDSQPNGQKIGRTGSPFHIPEVVIAEQRVFHFCQSHLPSLLSCVSHKETMR